MREVHQCGVLPWEGGDQSTPQNGNGTLPLLPVPLRYGGAHTHRLSGEWRMNLQNLPRDKVKSKLRQALSAPEGFKIVTADLSQIEARIVACLANQVQMVDQFRRSEDVYANFASQLFGKAVDKIGTPSERFIGKTGILGLGYGCGADRFYRMVTTAARQYGIPLDGLFDQQVAQRTVDTYRRTFRRIPQAWYTLDRLMAQVLMVGRETMVAGFGPVTLSSGRIRLPNGLYLTYQIPDLSLYGAKILENVTQALARIVVMQSALRLNARGYRFVLQAHDELAFVIPNDQLQGAKLAIQIEMTRPPTWLPELPLAVEISSGQDYGSCK